MKVYDAVNIRNVALVGHSGSGKTQLTSAILSDTGTINRFGKVDDGTTVTDYDEEEIARKHTLSASLAYVEWNKQKINLIDTPGAGNFFADALAGLSVADAALMVVDAVGGVMVQTEKAWAAADARNLPRLIAINRLDRERASLPRTLASLRELRSRSVIPIQLPIGDEKSFRGIVDLVSKTAFLFAANGSGVFTEGVVPAEMAEEVGAARDALIETVAENDETLMEHFFEAGTLTDQELISGLRSATIAGKLCPVVCLSGLQNIGVPQLLDAILAYLPSPAERPFAGVDRNGAAVSRAADAGAALSAVVWKTIADPFAGRLTMFRVISGVLRSDSTVHNKTKDAQERVGHLMLLEGKTPTNVTEIRAGDLGAVAKLRDTLTGDVIGDQQDPVTFPPAAFPEPVLSYAIEPKSRGDEDKISTSVHRLEEEDPSIHYSRDPQTHELLLSGQGQMHIEVTVAKLKRRFSVDVNLKPPHIAYRETIKAATEGHGRHKKQTGGHGQFGDCKIKVEPLARGSDFEFVDDIFGGSIPRQFVPAIEKGIQDARTKGYLAGFPMVDFRVTVFDGSYHDVDSNELSFKLAGSLAFRDAMTRARPTLLEPIVHVEVCAPSDFAGDVMGDLNGRRGHIAGIDTRGTTTVINALVPMAEMLTYEQHLTSATGGRGSYHIEPSHYDEVPAHLQAKIIATARAERAGSAVGEV
jgi:elongation factor G